MNKFERFNTDSEYKRESRSNQPESIEDKNDIQEQLLARESNQKTPEELEKIEEIHRRLPENIESASFQQENLIPKNPTEIEVINDQEYYVEYVPKGDIYPAYGYGGGNNVVVRQDLLPRVKRFVKAHELYHCQDKSNFGGWLGREIRANIVPGLKDPIGLAATVWKTITDVDRIKFYLKRIKKGR